ncbi:MAG TPA: class I SAM-dependent rRNA methyltransferase [Thermoanaerobaculia bacterium]|jgi:23S rRNA (cytosine1962-C5)-methyltransferase
MIRLKLKPGREVSVMRRHPWLFSGAVASAEGDGRDGHAMIIDAAGRPVARGAYSPGSQIVARLWTFDGRVPDGTLFRERFAAARKLRREVATSETTGYRAINSEGDLCPGVLLDVYGDTAVLELLTGGTETWRVDLESAAREVFALERLIVRESGSGRDRGQSKIQNPKSEIDLVPFLENGLHFLADVSSGQKTGFFLDQRENRSRLRALSHGGTVLNLFAYSGAFSIAALAGGAFRAVDVDSSDAALELAREHRRRNGFTVADQDFVAADVFKDLRQRVAAGQQWDAVVCDPPAFAKKKADLDRAARGYKDINRLAMALVSPGGWLLTCSCSGLVGADLFQKIVFSASLDSGVPFAIAARQGAGHDHPVSLDCPEGEYLKGLWLRRAA